MGSTRSAISSIPEATMKSIVICTLLVVISVGLTTAELGDGRPGCRTQEELRVSLYRNVWDPTIFWKCETLNQAARSVACPDKLVFQDKLKTCVTWDDWEWENPRAPPSRA